MSPKPMKRRSGGLVLALVLLLAVAVVAVCVLTLVPRGETSQPSKPAAQADTAPPETVQGSGADAVSDAPAGTDVPADTDAPAGTDAPVARAPLTCYVLDVGQGDSILLVSPNGKTMLIDAGDANQYDAVTAELGALGVTRLDVLVATHPHGDHIGAMGRLVKNLPIGACYLTEYTSGIYAYTRLLDALEDRNVPTYLADSDTGEIPWDDACTVTVLSPVAGVRYDDLNASSIVLRIAYGDTALLLMGDATVESERILLNTFPAETFWADVLKLGHHGSSDATSEQFLRAVGPSVAVVSLGAGNDYGHPHRETLALLQEYGLKLWRTDERGTVKIVLDGTAAAVVQ